jgi:type III secretory pathway component EscR
LDIYGFFEAIEILSQKVYKDEEDSTYKDNIEKFIDAGIDFFTKFLEQQTEEKEINKNINIKTGKFIK